jgi:hypothetical protein
VPVVPLAHLVPPGVRLMTRVAGVGCVPGRVSLVAVRRVVYVFMTRMHSQVRPPPLWYGKCGAS